ncbi:MAG: hypothetical protein RL685_7310, partial [Pseudomonadota bacterium]
MTYTQIFRAVCCACLATFVWASCKSDERSRPLPDENPGGLGGSRPISSLGGGGGSSGESVDAGADAALTCETLVCSGAGHCEVDTAGRAACLCDFGYKLVDDVCIVDEECINLRLLEDGCRQLEGAQPSLAIFFGLETCAGTTVRPDVLGPANSAFRVLEDGNPIGQESYVALFRRPVESYISIALDLSGSLQQDQALLVAVIGQMKEMVQGLAPAAGDPPVNVELTVFGRSIHTAVAFTTDLPTVIAQLDAIQANPAGAVAEPGGTNLFGVVNHGTLQLKAAMDTRRAQTLGAVVTTGTHVTITDGKDSSGEALKALNKAFNYISVGISADISDTELTRIGPQGSFLAPQQSDWTSAFNRVVARVLEYPQRSYLLGYCSPAVAGNHTVAVALTNRDANANATCSFSGAAFGVDQGACNEAFISGYCGGETCRDFLACGPIETADAGPPQYFRGDFCPK